MRQITSHPLGPLICPECGKRLGLLTVQHYPHHPSEVEVSVPVRTRSYRLRYESETFEQYESRMAAGVDPDERHVSRHSYVLGAADAIRAGGSFIEVVDERYEALASVWTDCPDCRTTGELVPEMVRRAMASKRKRPIRLRRVSI